jgi:MFS family permease
LTATAEHAWTHPSVLVPLAASLPLLAAFIWWEARAPAPMLPLHLFLSPAFTGANLMTLMLYFALSGALFFLPFDLIHVQGYSATLAGAAFLPLTLIMGTLSRWSGELVDRYGAKLPLTAGPAVASAGFALFALPGIGGSYWTTFFPAMVTLGLGMAISVAPLTTTVMDAVEDRHAGAASGVNNAIARIAGLLAVALMGTFAVGTFGSALDARLAQLQVPADVRSAMLAEVPKLAEAQVPPQVRGAERRMLEQAVNEAFVRSFRLVMLVAAALALASALCAALTPAAPRGKPAGPRRREGIAAPA